MNLPDFGEPPTGSGGVLRELLEEAAERPSNAAATCDECGATCHGLRSDVDGSFCTACWTEFYSASVKGQTGSSPSSRSEHHRPPLPPQPGLPPPPPPQLVQEEGWYFLDERGVSCGPHTLDGLRAAHGLSQLMLGSYVWAAGQAGWLRLADLPYLRAIICSYVAHSTPPQPTVPEQAVSALPLPAAETPAEVRSHTFLREPLLDPIEPPPAEAPAAPAPAETPFEAEAPVEVPVEAPAVEAPAEAPIEVPVEIPMVAEASSKVSIPVEATAAKASVEVPAEASSVPPRACADQQEPALSQTEPETPWRQLAGGIRRGFRWLANLAPLSQTPAHSAGVEGGEWQEASEKHVTAPEEQTLTRSDEGCKSDPEQFASPTEGAVAGGTDGGTDDELPPLEEVGEDSQQAAAQPLSPPPAQEEPRSPPSRQPSPQPPQPLTPQPPPPQPPPPRQSQMPSPPQRPSPQQPAAPALAPALAHSAQNPTCGSLARPNPGPQCSDTALSVVFAEQGPLGLIFSFVDAADPDNDEAEEVTDGRPVRVQVAEVQPETQAEAHPHLAAGMVLTHADGAALSGMSFAQVDATLRQAVGGGARPLELRFEGERAELPVSATPIPECGDGFMGWRAASRAAQESMLKELRAKEMTSGNRNIVRPERCCEFLLRTNSIRYLDVLEFENIPPVLRSTLRRGEYRSNPNGVIGEGEVCWPASKPLVARARSAEPEASELQGLEDAELINRWTEARSGNILDHNGRVLERKEPSLELAALIARELSIRREERYVFLKAQRKRHISALEVAVGADRGGAPSRSLKRRGSVQVTDADRSAATEWSNARRNRDYGTADVIRAELRGRGISVEKVAAEQAPPAGQRGAGSARDPALPVRGEALGKEEAALVEQWVVARRARNYDVADRLRADCVDARLLCTLPYSDPARLPPATQLTAHRRRPPRSRRGCQGRGGGSKASGARCRGAQHGPQPLGSAGAGGLRGGREAGRLVGRGEGEGGLRHCRQNPRLDEATRVGPQPCAVAASGQQAQGGERDARCGRGGWWGGAAGGRGGRGGPRWWHRGWHRGTSRGVCLCRGRVKSDFATVALLWTA